MNNSNIILIGNRFILETQYKQYDTFIGNKEAVHIEKNIKVDTIINSKLEAYKIIDEYFDMLEKIQKV